MFKHLLLPTDGSPLSEAAIQKGIEFAKGIGAKIPHLLTYRTEMLEDTREEYERDSREHAKQYLAVIEKAVKDASVECETEYVTSDHPHEAILEAAERKGCDLIAMASHGRKGMDAVLLGSETQKVLTHSRTPALVYR